MLIDPEALMKTWSIQDAEAHFSEMLDTCLKQGPQLVIQHGREAAVLVPIAEWHRLRGAPVRTLKDLLLTDEARGELKIPPRGRHPRRRASRPAT
jgi:prevent-host-death family protein